MNCVRDGVGRHQEDPGGTFELKIVRDFGGFVLDATGLSQEGILEYFTHDPRRPTHTLHKPVRGVLYPQLETGSGLPDSQINAFNTAQEANLHRFAEYFEEQYRQPYTFAATKLKTSFGKHLLQALGRKERP